MPSTRSSGRKQRKHGEVDRLKVAGETNSPSATVLRPELQGAVTIKGVNRLSDASVDLELLVAALADQARAVTSGNMDRPEAMLMTHASTLDAIFNALARRAMLADRLESYEAHMRLALKAQSQARATIETLAEMKSPRQVLIARQANVSAGPQQINNGPSPSVRRARRSGNRPTEVLETGNGESQRVVTGAARAASRVDPKLATVDAVDRAENPGRKGEI